MRRSGWRLTGRTMVALFLAFASVVASQATNFTGARAQTADESLNLTPSSGPAGSVVYFAWNDDNDSSSVNLTLTFDGNQIATFQSDSSDENYTGQFSVPTDAQPVPIQSK